MPGWNWRLHLIFVSLNNPRCSRVLKGNAEFFIGGSGSVGIAPLIGIANMMDMMPTGRVLTAEDAYWINMFQYLVENGGAFKKAKETASTASLSNFAIINALPRIQDMGMDDGLFVETLMSSITSSSPETRQRLQDFPENRTAKIAPNRGK